MYRRVLCGLLANRTRILVTHLLHFIWDSNVTRVAAISGGAITGVGSPGDMLAAGFLSPEAARSPVAKSQGLESAIAEEDEAEDGDEAELAGMLASGAVAGRAPEGVGHGVDYRGRGSRRRQHYAEHVCEVLELCRGGARLQWTHLLDHNHSGGSPPE